MINVYIKELEKKEEISLLNKTPNWARNVLYRMIKKFNIVIEKKIDDNNKIYLIPNIEKIKKYNKIRERLKKEKTKTQKVQVILSKKIKKYKDFFKDYKIVDGRNIFLNSIDDILEKILENSKIEMQDIYVLTNQYSEKSMAIIKSLAIKSKSMNIITKEVEKYKILEEILEKKGIAICISNNKKKSLKRAKIIINIDFIQDNLKQYNIFRNSIIINVPNEKIMNINCFEGVIIQDIEIELQDEEKNFIKQNYLENEFNQLDIYESIHNNDKEHIKISSLYGNNGKISEKELGNMQKILTNLKN